MGTPCRKSRRRGEDRTMMAGGEDDGDILVFIIVRSAPIALWVDPHHCVGVLGVGVEGTTHSTIMSDDRFLNISKGVELLLSDC